MQPNSMRISYFLYVNICSINVINVAKCCNI